MSVRNLEFLFHPRSIAVIAEAEEPGRYAEVVLANLSGAAFPGTVSFASAKKPAFFLLRSAVQIGELPQVPDLAIICAALDNVPSIISQLAARGTRAAIIGPWRWHRMVGNQVQAARKAILEAAQPTLMRVLGPGSGGLVVPARGVNASASPVPISGGKIALVSQSTAVLAAILDRACSKGIGFSTVVHLGTSIDVDLADVLDWLATDAETRSILVHFDSLPAGRKFMSAARAAARHKPVVCIRSQRAESGRSVRGPVTTEAVDDAALRRAGWVRIDTLGDLFDAVEAMARARATLGERLLILANGHGLGQIAADTLLRCGGQLGELTPDVARHLAGLLPTRSLPGNPLALPADVTPATWGAALSALLADGSRDAVMTVCSPSPFAPSSAVATAISDAARDSVRNVFTCWVGGSGMREAQQLAASSGLFSHESPERAIAVFLGVLNYRRNRSLLLQMPPSLAEDFAPDGNAARSVIGDALAAGAESLTAAQRRRLLHAYGISAPEYPAAGSIDAAVAVADQLGYPVDLGLVFANAIDFPALATGLRSPAAIRLAVRSLRSEARARYPARRVSGYRLRPSVARSGAPVLRLGVAEDSHFCPVIYLGPAASASRQAGTFVVALPPLNAPLARDLVLRSDFAGELPAAQREPLLAAVSNVLVRLSQLITDLDAVVGVDLDPLLVESSGVVVVDGSVRLARGQRTLGSRRFAIRPYPKELERFVDWGGRPILIRPLRPEDEPLLGELLNSLAPEDSRMRFFDSIRNLPRSRIARFTQIDYDREMALVAVQRQSDGREAALGEVRAVADPDGLVADFAVVVASPLKGQGLGRLLLQQIIDYCRARGIGELRGETLAGNLRMQRLATAFGFTTATGADRGAIDLRLVLREAARRAPVLRRRSR